MGSTGKYIIVGGGLSGLSLAYQLSQIGINATILEASSRLGGRIQTIKGKKDTPLELGATWFSDIHPSLLEFIDELGLSKYEQYSKGISLFETKSFEPPQEFFIPESKNPSYRISGGTQRIIDTLAEKISRKNIHLNAKVHSLTVADDLLKLETSDGKIYHGDKVILCIPPELISKIRFSPALPDDLKQLLPEVQTWMAGALKFVVEYDKSFWRQKGYSGMLFSHAGIVSEMYDHTNLEESKYGFTGFLNGGAVGYSKETRKNQVLQHLKKLLGEKAASPIFYEDKIWTDEFVISGNQNIQWPHQNNGHLLLQKGFFNEKLFLCNTETSPEFSGYMEGAIRASTAIFEKLK